MDTNVETITPTKAKEWLSFVKNNRTISQRAVDRYANAMKAGQWLTTHQGIAFDENGTLLDGQHRLMAVIEANTNVSMQVTRGLPVSYNNGVELFTMDCIDNGKTRSLANQLQITHGIAQCNNIAGACSAIAKFLGFEGSLTMPQALAILDIYKGHITYCVLTLSSLKPLRRVAYSGVFGFVRCANKAFIDGVVQKLVSGEGMSRNDPILTFRNWAINRIPTAACSEAKQILLVETAFNCLYNAIHNNQSMMVKRGKIGRDYFVKQQRSNVSAIRKALGMTE